MKPIILAVDDSKAIRFLLQSIFGKKYQVVTAADASSAMYWLSRKNMPQLIITASELPDVEDWEFIANLKNSFLYQPIPTVVLSSKVAKETESKCKSYGIDYYFQKPFNPVELIELVDELLSKEKIY
ncbi:MAG: response regulator [Sphingobacteriales bacterium]|nr:MAG: response regulator [Sphingobacteriales bacterium]